MSTRNQTFIVQSLRRLLSAGADLSFEWYDDTLYIKTGISDVFSHIHKNDLELCKNGDDYRLWVELHWLADSYERSVGCLASSSARGKSTCTGLQGIVPVDTSGREHMKGQKPSTSASTDDFAFDAFST